MKSGSDLWIKVVMPLVLLVSAAAVVVTTTVVVRRMAADARTAAASGGVEVVAGGDEPIAAEANVFRTSARVLAIDPTPAGRRPAHPRTLATYRNLRAYPGAPPRIPHGLTPEETHTGGCNTCHERGGYSQRFGAYVPINPHPELGACLQCHVGDASLLSVPLPGMDPSARCRQCHTEGGTRRVDTSITWQAMAWPRVTRGPRDQSPPPIPHGREMRNNCLACHSAPAAIAEITTSHPERANCRQCHVESNSDVGEFVPAATQPARGGNGSQ